MAKEPALSRHVFKWSGGQQGLRLLSDVHLGSPNFDEKRFKKDLADAQSSGDRIAINGDLFDLILPSDRKRFEMSALHPRLHGEDNLIGAVIDWAKELLSPYSDLIDFVAPGNHESNSRRHHHVDLTSEFVKSLGGATTVRVAEYAGWATYVNSKTRFNLFHWHGHGKGTGRLAGLLGEFDRKSSAVEGADACWFGHHHGMAIGRSLRHSPLGRPKPCWLIRTPSYLDGTAYRGYASEALHCPYPTGCVRLVLFKDGSSSVEVK